MDGTSWDSTSSLAPAPQVVWLQTVCRLIPKIASCCWRPAAPIGRYSSRCLRRPTSKGSATPNSTGCTPPNLIRPPAAVPPSGRAGKSWAESSSINGMLYVRGFPQDFDDWRQKGNAGWSWEDVLPLFKRQEDNARGASSHHGTGGLLTVSDLQNPHPIAKIFLDAAAAAGFPYNPVYQRSLVQIEGFGYVQATQRRGWRCSAAKAFVDPILNRSNFKVSRNSTAQRLLIRDQKVVGIEVKIAGKIVTLTATREVVLCCGAIASPQLLALSGIGPIGGTRSSWHHTIRRKPGGRRQSSGSSRARHDLRGCDPHL